MTQRPGATSSEAATPEFVRPSWRVLLLIGALIVLCYAPILYRLVLNWAADEDMGHGFLVLPVAGFIVWKRRKTLAKIPVKPNIWGLILVGVAAVQALAATLAAELFTARLAFVFALTGCVLYLGGKAWLKALALPLTLLLFMIPIPQMIYARLTLSLQFLASELAEGLITVSGIPVMRTGNILYLPHETLNVVEACSGIRSLITLSFLSLVYAYFFDKRVWMRWALLAATVPIAIAANAIRVAVTGLLSQADAQLVRGVFHETEGLLLFLIALIGLMLTHRLIAAIADRGQSGRPEGANADKAA